MHVSGQHLNPLHSRTLCFCWDIPTETEPTQPPTNGQQALLCLKTPQQYHFIIMEELIN